MLSRLRSARVVANHGKKFVRHLSSEPGLKEVFASKIPIWQKEIKELKTLYGDKILGTCTVEQAYGGMRSVKSMVYETSLLDPVEGIRFRGLTIPECQVQLPKAPGGQEPLPEALLWLLLTGDVPSDAQVQRLSFPFALGSSPLRSALPLVLNFPKDLHPMTQFSMAILACQKESNFAAAYAKGMKKNEYWDHTYEDMLTCIARLPRIAALIYRNVFKNGDILPAVHDKDMSANFTEMLGMKDPMFAELMRLYLCIHSDHEGGNVSAHTCHLVGSALSDTYLSLSASMNGLAGPLHGLANQEVLKFIKDFKEDMGSAPLTEEAVKAQCWKVLNSGRVIPGYGHAVLRKTDPRYTCQAEFAKKHIKDDEMVKLVQMICQVAPGVLTEHGKTKNPWPNVDAHSGVLLVHYGMTEEEFFTVMFGVGRALGVLPMLTISRALGFSLERPKSLTTSSIKKTMEIMYPHGHA
ncbi:chicken citrate synthase complex with trifluoroacetonyl-CoA and citrate [Baffinella frigidus]|nr:chicken citrate synthase complex with trifluoroacetonyl-CoA and citrate [Cryptophyta sp. CCMP2293]